jgi:hypothetical protein
VKFRVYARFGQGVGVSYDMKIKLSALLSLLGILLPILPTVEPRLAGGMLHPLTILMPLNIAHSACETSQNAQKIRV